MKVGLVAEVRWEVRTLFRRFKLRPVNMAKDAWEATVNGHVLRLCLSGMVPAHARTRVTRFLDAYQPDLMISCGLAGALRPHVGVGDLIVQTDFPILAERADDALREAGVPYHVGPLVTVTKPILSPVDRYELAGRTQAIGVDMESQTIAALCRTRGIPSLAIKGVSDGMDDDLTPILGGFDVVDIPRIAWRVLARPSTWPLAAHLAGTSYRSATHLGQGLCAVLMTLRETDLGDTRMNATQDPGKSEHGGANEASIPNMIPES